MKKTVLTFCHFFVCIIAFGQIAFTPQIINGMFNTKIENGIGQEKSIAFKVSKEMQIEIKKISGYKEIKNDTKFLSSIFKKGTKIDTLAAYFYSEVNGAALIVKWKLENKSSFTIIENTTGLIEMEDGKLVISFPFKSQNEVGNMVFHKAKIKGTEVEIE